jgi:hypothetical protein
VNALVAVLHREGRIRATNWAFIFWDIFYPIAYLLVFGVGMNHALGFQVPNTGVDYDSFFLAGVLGMASFGIASNTRGRSSWTATTACSRKCSPIR